MDHSYVDRVLEEQWDVEAWRETVDTGRRPSAMRPSRVYLSSQGVHEVAELVADGTPAACKLPAS